MASFDNIDFQQARQGEALVVIFRDPVEEEMVKDEVASRKAGHAVYKEEIICEIRIPADRNRVFATPHTAACMVDGQWTTYAERFPREFQRYMEKKGPSVVGTPLHEAPWISTAKRAELRALNVHTIEILAGLSGQPAKNLGIGGMALIEQAKAWLETAKSNAVPTRLAAENAELRELMAQMKADIAAMKGGAPKPEEPDYNPDTGDFDDISAPATASHFEHWDDASLKQLIKKKTGEGVRGNPAHATLVARAEEVKGYDDAE
jgi:hypothetical protein